MRSIVRKVVPPIFIDAFTKYNIRSKYGWFGNYSSWEEALKQCNGYNSEIIFQKVKDSSMMVKERTAVYERDSVIFDNIEISYPVLSGLLLATIENKNNLFLIDFGGALGSTYYQNRDLLSGVDDLKWNIIEQKRFVDIGKENFENQNLKFFYTIEDCLYATADIEQPNIVILSSVLQYLEKPYEFLNYLLSFKIKYLLFDRTSFLFKGSDRITIQKVPSSIYEATYPCWFLDEEKFLKLIGLKYNLIYKFLSYVKDEELIYIDNKPLGVDRGYLFKLR